MENEKTLKLKPAFPRLALNLCLIQSSGNKSNAVAQFRENANKVI